MRVLLSRSSQGSGLRLRILRCRAKVLKSLNPKPGLGFKV